MQNISYITVALLIYWTGLGAVASQAYLLKEFVFCSVVFSESSRKLSTLQMLVITDILGLDIFQSLPFSITNAFPALVMRAFFVKPGPPAWADFQCPRKESSYCGKQPLFLLPPEQKCLQFCFLLSSCTMFTSIRTYQRRLRSVVVMQATCNCNFFVLELRAKKNDVLQRKNN